MRRALTIAMLACAVACGKPVSVKNASAPPSTTEYVPMAAEEPGPAGRQSQASLTFDRTQGGIYEWGTGPDGRDTVIAIEGRPVPDHFDSEALYRAEAARRGISLEAFKAQLAANRPPAGTAIEWDDFDNPSPTPPFMQEIANKRAQVVGATESETRSDSAPSESNVLCVEPPEDSKAPAAVIARAQRLFDECMKTKGAKAVGPVVIDCHWF